MQNYYCEPMVESIRGSLVESIHFGALAVVDSNGKLLGSIGDVGEVLYLRSSSKPFQTIPLVEMGGVEFFKFTEKELAITCASHQGTDEHVATLKSMHQKIGISVEDLLCGVHPPADRDTYDAMIRRGEEPDAYRHNCSGKHTGMLAQAKLQDFDFENYVSPEHPVQKRIIQTFAEMADVPVEEVVIGVDGCSVPVFGVPLWKAAFAYARLCDPVHLGKTRQVACRKITNAITHYPEMISGPKGMDTVLMKAAKGKIISKGGADGYQAIGILPDARYPGSPGVGITFKITDGDASGRARGVVAVEMLRLFGIFDESALADVAEYGARPIYNVRKYKVGNLQPCFSIKINK